MSRSLVQDPPAAGEAVSADSLYERDFYGWVNQQVGLLRAGRLDALDLENLAEELQDVGSEQYDKLESALTVLLAHMLKWDFQPERRSRSWALTIREQRERIAIQLRRNPSLKSRVAEAVGDGYRLGKLRAARETSLEPETLPVECPYPWTDILERAFDYAAPDKGEP